MPALRCRGYRNSAGERFGLKPSSRTCHSSTVSLWCRLLQPEAAPGFLPLLVAVVKSPVRFCLNLRIRGKEKVVYFSQIICFPLQVFILPFMEDVTQHDWHVSALILFCTILSWEKINIHLCRIVFYFGDGKVNTSLFSVLPALPLC